MSFERLSRDHDALEKKRAALLSAVRGAPEPSAALGLLANFSVALDEHRAAEQQFVYLPLLHLAERQDLPLDFELSRIVAEMNHDWGGYLHDWDLDSIAGDWKSFAEQTEEMLRRGGERLRLENEVIYPLALRLGTMPLRDTRS